MTERTYTTDLIRGEDIKISIGGHNCIAHIDNRSGMTIMTLKTFGELKGKIAKPMTYSKFDKPFSFQSSSDHAIVMVCKGREYNFYFLAPCAIWQEIMVYSHDL